MPPSYCKICDKELSGKNAIHCINHRIITYKLIVCQRCHIETQRNSSRQKYCPDCSKIIYLEQLHNNYKKLKSSRPIKNLKCKSCGKKFEVSKEKLGRRKYCSVECRELFYNYDWRKQHRISYFNTMEGRIKTYLRNDKRRLFKKNLEENFTYEEWFQKLMSSGGICVSCGKNIGIEKLTLDHIYPISKAHEDYLKTGIKRIYTINDIQPICCICNIKKGNKVI